MAQRGQIACNFRYAMAESRLQGQAAEARHAAIRVEVSLAIAISLPTVAIFAPHAALAVARAGCGAGVHGRCDVVHARQCMHCAPCGDGGRCHGANTAGLVIFIPLSCMYTDVRTYVYIIKYCMGAQPRKIVFKSVLLATLNLLVLSQD